MINTTLRAAQQGTIFAVYEKKSEKGATVGEPLGEVDGKESKQTWMRGGCLHRLLFVCFCCLWAYCVFHVVSETACKRLFIVAKDQGIL